jgi:hypothetical protein
MLNEIECLLNNHLESFAEYETEDSKLFESVQKQIKQQNRTRARNENAEREAADAQAKKIARDKEQENRVIKKTGKPLMKTTWKPPVKKVEVKKKMYTQEEEDMITYGLKDLVH